MAEKVLSQEEIDALLHGIESGKVDTTSAPPGEAEVSTFDFANPDQIIHGRMPTLDILNEFLARLLRNTLSMVLRKGVDVTPQKTQLMKYEEFTRILSVPCCLHIFKMEPLRGHCVLALEPKLVFLFVEIFLGGSGKANFRVEGRDFSAIESKLIHKVVTVIFTETEKVWNSVHPISVQFVRSEFSPQFVSIVPPSDLVLTVPFALELDQFTGLITFCIPFSTLEPIKNKLYSGYQADHLEVDQGWVERLKEQLIQTEVEVVVEFAKTLIPAQKILNLRVGDILPLGKETSELIQARVQGVPKFAGRAGIYGSSKAFQVEERIKPS